MEKNKLSFQLNADDFLPAGEDEKKSLVVMRESVGFWKDGMRRFKKNKIAMVSLIVVILIFILSFIVPQFYPYKYEQQIKGSNSLAPFEYSQAEQEAIANGEKVFPHILGTDQLGRDYAIRVMMGSRVSLTVGLVASAIILLIGSLYGSIAGFFGGWVDMVMMRIVDIIYTVPDVLIVILLAAVLNYPLKELAMKPGFEWIGLIGVNLISIFVVFALLYWVGMARIVRSQIMILKEQEYVTAARALGASSGSIIKNVKSVIVPNTNHLKGIPAAAAAGIVAGDSDKELEVIAEVTPDETRQMKEFLDDTEIRVEHVDNGITFDIIVTLYKGDSYAKVRIANYHTNIVLIEKNGEILKQVEVAGEEEEGLTDRSLLNMEDIWDFINTVDIEDIREVLDRQIKYNWAIAQEGLKGDYGANIGSVLLEMSGNDVRTRAKAMAAAGSDARMNGCELPVIINSGSGNQGITASVPVLVYAEEFKVDEDKKYRALALSNLTAIHQKTPIGRLSAYCGAVSAGAGAGAGIAYLCGGGFKEVVHTVVNALAIVSGIVCDGAKASCAAKIASAVDAGILGYNMYIRGQQFYGGDGIVTKGVEATLKNVGRLGKEGMKETNEEIIKIMIGE